MSPGLRQLSPFYLAPPHPRSPMPCRGSSLLLTMLVMMMMAMTMMLQLVKVVVCSGHWLSADFSIGSWINGGWRAYWSERGDLLMRTKMLKYKLARHTLFVCAWVVFVFVIVYLILFLQIYNFWFNYKEHPIVCPKRILLEPKNPNQNWVLWGQICPWM